MEERISCAFKPLNTWCYVFPNSVSILLDGFGKLSAKLKDISDSFSSNKEGECMKVEWLIAR